MFSNICRKCQMPFTTRKREQIYCSKSCANSVSSSRRKIEDNSIFENGLDATNSYILGLIYSDGCLSFDSHTQKYRISISMNEKELMQQIQKIMTPYKKLYDYKHPRGKQATYSVISTNKKDISFLRTLGMTERKSLTLSFPDIDKIYLPHFIRGYFDGDGSIYVNTTTTHYKGIIKKYYYTNVSFTTGSKKFATKLQNILMNNCIKCTLVKDSRVDNSSWYVKIYNQDNVINFYYYIYTNSKLYLERKHYKFTKMI